MSINYLDSSQYLLSSQIDYTLTHFADHIQKFSHDPINHYLNSEDLTSELLWKKVRLQLENHPHASLIFDDTILDKRYSDKIEIVRYQYSGNEHRALKLRFIEL